MATLFNDNDENELDDAEVDVGPCKTCQFFDVNRAEDNADDETLAPCLHPDLEEYELVVSGDSGCNLYEPCEDEDGDEDEGEEGGDGDQDEREDEENDAEERDSKNE